MRALMLAVLLSACVETIDHTPVGSCAASTDCPCEEECYVPDGGDLAVCGARVTPVCTSVHDCTSPQTCLHVVRDGGACSYTQCQ